MSLKYVPPDYLEPMLYEQSMKEWVRERATEAGVDVATVYRRVKRGELQPIITRRVNKRVVFVFKGVIAPGTRR